MIILELDARQQLLNRETAMRDVLRRISMQASLDNLSAEDMRLAKDCCDAGYIEGVVFLEMISGRIVAEYRHEPRLTRSGLAFLAEETEEPAADEDQENNHFFKKVLHCLKPPVKVVWALFVGLSVFVTVFGWPLILRFLSFLLSLF